MKLTARAAATALCLCLLAVGAQAQDVCIGCRLEDYSIKPLIYGRVGDPNQKLQVVMLRNPAGEQEARFDLYHGAALISLRYLQRELLYAQEPGASVALSIPHQVTKKESKITYPTFPSSSEYRASQAGISMWQPATTGAFPATASTPCAPSP